MSSSSQVFWKSPDPESPLRAALAGANTQLQELASQQWDPKTATIDGIRDVQLCSLASAPNAWSSLLLHLNSRLADQLAVTLSTTTDVPVIGFYEFDQLAWGFSVHERGHSIAQFWNRPEVLEEDPYRCRVDPNLIAGLFGVGVEAVSPYLNHLAPDSDEAGKAFPEDEFSLGDHWVRCDFMRRLGLRYPNPGETGTRYVFIKERRVN